MSLATILAWMLLATGVTLTPGPDSLLVMSQSARGGVRQGLMVAAGIQIGGLWYVALCGFGFLSVLAAWPTLFMIVRIAGAVYLAYVGLRLLLGSVRSVQKAETAPKLGNPFVQGLMSNVLNPKVGLFYLAVLPQFVGVGPDAPLNGMALIALHYATSALWLPLVAFGFARMGTMLRQSRIVRIVEGAVGLMLMGFAGKLAFERS